MNFMNFIELVVLSVGAFYIGAKIGERICLVIDKVMYEKELNRGCVFFHRTSGGKVVIDSVISGSLFKKPTVKFSVGNEGLQIQMNLREFLKQFKYAQYNMRGE